LKVETDPDVRAEIQDAIQTRENQVASLRTIENNAKRTEIKMDNTVAQLSTVFAQMQLLNSRELDSGRAQRLRDEIREEIVSLNDMVSAMDDVYDYNQKKKDYEIALDSLGEAEGTDADASEASVRRTSSNRSS
jgi:hypothetical protein